MLMLKKPLRLKSLLGITYNDAFSDRIRANYEFMTAVITKEELLHLLLGEPKQTEQRSSVTMIVENTAVVNQNEIIIQLINQVLNRVLMMGETGIAYQDNVYIGCILRKFGIADIRTFLERIRSSKEEYILKNQLLKKYEREKNFLKIYELTGNKKPENQTDMDKISVENLEKKEENYLYEKVVQRLCTMEIYQIVSEWNYTQGAGQKILFHNELALSEQQENVLNMRLVQKKREYVYPHCQMNFISLNLYETELPDNVFNRKRNIAVAENSISVVEYHVSVMRENVFAHLLKAALFSLAKSVSLAAVFRQDYGKKENHWFEMGFEICNIAKNTLNRCQWQYQNRQVLNIGEIQRVLEQQNHLYRYELYALQKLTENKESIKELLIYKENIKDREIKSRLDQDNLNENKPEQDYLEQSGLNQYNLEQNVLDKTWPKQNNSKENNLNQDRAEKSSLDNKEITLKLKEILNGKNIEAVRNAERWKEKMESFRAVDKEKHIEKGLTEKKPEGKEQPKKQERNDEWKRVAQETENEKLQKKRYTENKKIFLDLYFEIQRIEMAENYLSKYFRISGKKSEEIGEESLAVFEKFSVPVNEWVEEIFLKERKNKEHFSESQQKQIIEYFSESQFEGENKENKQNNNRTENNFSQNNIIFSQTTQLNENKSEKDIRKRDNLEIDIKERTKEKIAEKKQIQREKIQIEREELQKEKTTEEIHEIFNKLTVQKRVVYEQKENSNISEQNNLFFNTKSGWTEQPLISGSQNLYGIYENQTDTDQTISTLYQVSPDEKEISEKNEKEIQKVFRELDLQTHKTDYNKSTADIQSLSNPISFVKTQSESAGNASVLETQNNYQVSEVLTDIVQPKIIHQNNTDIHNLNQIKKDIREQAAEAMKEIQSKNSQEQTIQATREIQSKNIQKQTIETAKELLSKNVQKQAAETTEKILEKELVLEHMPLTETEKNIQKEVEKGTQKDVIQQIFHEIETEILYETQKNTQNLQKNQNYFYQTKVAEIVYHQIRPDMPEPVDLNENTKRNTNITVTVTEKMLSQNKIKISGFPATNQNQTKTDIKQINEAVQVIQNNIQKHINQITEQVYQKIEKKLQNERRRRGL